MRNNADIIMFRPDKWSGVVVMNISDYKNKMESIFSAENKFMADVDSDGLRKVGSEFESNEIV